MENQMNAKKAIAQLFTADPNSVIRCYNGKEGCRCGCNGTYKTNPAHVVLAGKRRGYKIREDEISMRSIKSTMTKMKKMADLTNITLDDFDDEYCINLTEPHGRVHTLYILK